MAKNLKNTGIAAQVAWVIAADDGVIKGWKTPGAAADWTTSAGLTLGGGGSAPSVVAGTWKSVATDLISMPGAGDITIDTAVAVDTPFCLFIVTRNSNVTWSSVNRKIIGAASTATGVYDSAKPVLTTVSGPTVQLQSSEGSYYLSRLTRVFSAAENYSAFFVSLPTASGDSPTYYADESAAITAISFLGTNGNATTQTDVFWRFISPESGFDGDIVAIGCLRVGPSIAEANSIHTDPIGTLFDTVAPPAPIITGPTGAAGAATSTFSLAELSATGPLFSTDIALGSGFPTLTGAAASAYTLVNVGTNQWRANPVAPFNFEGLAPANPHVLTFNASASVSQTSTGNITNVAEGAVFAGTLSVPTQTVGSAMSNINVAAFFTPVDAGDAGTFSLDGGAIPGLAVSADGSAFGGTASTAGSYTGRRIARAGSNGITSYSNLFTVTVNAVGDTTVPTLTGGISVGATTPTGYSYSHPAGADNVAVASYERSVDGGATWADQGNVLSGTVSGRTPGSVDALRIRARDAAGNVSTPALAASVPLDVYKCSILDWVLPTTSQHAIGELWNISFHNATTRALVANLPSTALVAGVNGAGQPSRNLVAGSAAFVQGTTYAWLATHPTNPTWFACGVATAA